MNSFLYLHTTDLPASRRFYTELIGLDEIYHSEADGTVGYRVGTVQLTVATGRDATAPQGWAHQPGWHGGTEAVPSWGFELDGQRFDTAVRALLADGAPTWRPTPEWVGYWSFPVRDPMGNTVEVTTPNRDGWPGGRA